MTLQARRIWSHASIGMSLPGSYYFLTLTSSPGSPDISRSWGIMRKRLLRKGYKHDYFGVRTNEGHDVLHIILRLENRLCVNYLRMIWIEVHNARQLRIDHVNQKVKLAKYLQDQGFKQQADRVAWEISKQIEITGRLQSKYWVYPGWYQSFKRIWKDHIDDPVEDRVKYFLEWADYNRQYPNPMKKHK